MKLPCNKRCSVICHLYFIYCALFVTDGHTTSVGELPSMPITLLFERIDLPDAFKILGELGQVNLLGIHLLTGSTWLHFKNVSWNNAFELLLQSNQLSYIKKGNLIWIAPISQIKADPHRHTDQLQLSSSKNKQILIEARIVEADSRFARNLGVKLGISNTSVTAPNQTPSPRLHSDLGADGLNGFPASSAAITMLNKKATQLLQIELSSLESDGRGRIVSNPRIVTTNAVKAMIEQGTELPYQTSTKDGARVHFRKANLRLEVTPKIQDGSIQMDVEISKDTIGTKTEQGYAIDTKHLRSQIMVEDGGTVVIGGIFLQIEREDVLRIPFLGEIPILGNLFKHQAKITDKTELLVFLTPTLINHKGEKLSE